MMPNNLPDPPLRPSSFPLNRLEPQSRYRWDSRLRRHRDCRPVRTSDREDWLVPGAKTLTFADGRCARALEDEPEAISARQVKAEK